MMKQTTYSAEVERMHQMNNLTMQIDKSIADQSLDIATQELQHPISIKLENEEEKVTIQFTDREDDNKQEDKNEDTIVSDAKLTENKDSNTNQTEQEDVENKAIEDAQKQF